MGDGPEPFPKHAGEQHSRLLRRVVVWMIQILRDLIYKKPSNSGGIKSTGSCTVSIINSMKQKRSWHVMVPEAWGEVEVCHMTS